MTGFIIRRLGQAIIVILGVTVITFLLLHLLPGSLARDDRSVPRASPQAIAQFNQQNGLNKPFFVQYWDVPGPAPARQPRLLVPVQPHGRLAARERTAEGPRARRAVADLLAADRDSGRDRPGGQAQQGRRLRRHGGQLHPLLDAAVRDRAAADPVPVDQLPRLPGRGARRRPRRSRCSEHPKGLVLPVASLTLVTLRVLQPLHALLGDRHARAGLHPHRAGQGTARAAGAAAPPAAQLADRGRHARRAVDPRDPHRHADHRAGVQLPRRRPRVLPSRRSATTTR